MWNVILPAAFGAIAIRLLDFAEAANLPKDRRPDFHDRIYWFSYLPAAVIGAALASIYHLSGMELKPIIAFHIGASSPLLLRAIASATPAAVKVDPSA